MKAFISLLISTVVMLGGLIVETHSDAALRLIHSEHPTAIAVPTALSSNTAAFIQRAAVDATMHSSMNMIEATNDDAPIYRF